jgi:hypothetical protein
LFPEYADHAFFLHHLKQPRRFGRPAEAGS